MSVKYRIPQEIWVNVADNISDALLVQDKNGNIIYVNSAALNLFGYSMSEALTFNSYQLYKDGITNKHIFGQLLKEKRMITAVQIITKKDLTHTHPMLVTQTPIFDEVGNVKYSIEIIRDIDSLNIIYKDAVRKAYNENSLYCGSTLKKPDISRKFIIAGKAMENLLNLVNQVADSNATVFIQGESGTGKELLAEYVHKISERSQNEMVTINCAALPENLLEPELFGYEKGSFTGAVNSGKPGLIEIAHKGTLFLDEIDSLPFSLQSKLLRVIETRHMRRVGSVVSKFVDFRLIAATNANLEEAIREKKFRADLYHRLNILPFTIPPLRERIEEIRPLCQHFLELFTARYLRKKQFSEKVLRRLESYSWPGNIRELRNLVERIVLMTDSNIELVDDIPKSLFLDEMSHNRSIAYSNSKEDIFASATDKPPFDAKKDLNENVRLYEQWVIQNAVNELGSLSTAAKHLGVHKSTLIRKRKNTYN